MKLEESQTSVDRLPAEQRRISQDSGTERPFSGAYNDDEEPGISVEVVAGEPLFASTDKFDSGSGWPSFTKPTAPANVNELRDTTHGMVRTKVRLVHPDGHLGHVFPDGPSNQGGLRYCINSASLRLIPRDDMESEGHGAYLDQTEEA
ncbi:peptide-methionine (R)-S-oxide reductase MsrB [Sphingomonas sp. R86520]|uniref:peptide-methionine (R)-S-oxide reductase MsrB n=1 Tax=Sphingomonas sp. R86520 TaxID=3093859 RepID=UPI0036D3E70E